MQVVHVRLSLLRFYPHADICQLVGIILSSIVKGDA